MKTFYEEDIEKVFTLLDSFENIALGKDAQYFPQFVEGYTQAKRDARLALKALVASKEIE
ncbi:hypothetical protein [Bacillus sp. XF8]|uniref:hypothetical protein n=1 Tax=Bacillus sp. XF8 TaxID=2819289 RepID=UPI001AA052E0|nr:hypothetical protein [Bacillus sp. XF8]MBO1582686.1 hypothetical protein [Bacillus sp. XF8]